MIHSMTGFASRIFNYKGERYKIEIKSLNHRFLEIKYRIPREWTLLESSMRSLIETKLKRGALDLWIEKATDAKSGASEIRLNLPQAEKAFEVLKELQRKFRIEDPITLRDLVSFPEVIGKPSAPVLGEEALAELKELLIEELSLVLDDLSQMRKQEGEKIKKSVQGVLTEFRNAHHRFLNQRDQLQKKSREKIKRKIESCFEAYSTPDAQMRSLMETRIAQEVAYTLDKSDIEEELNRFKGHVDQIETLILTGGWVGKKLDFMFQELSREINTLGNKAQDLDISHDVVELKTWIEQLREQCLNLE